ncbi:MAG: nuclear transport factor 2 family protein [Burkholderiales bacterium]
MNKRVQSGLLAAVALAAAGLAAWWYAGASEEREIKRRFTEFAEEFNASTTDGLGTMARAARLGAYFTPDIVVELGQGSPPIHGRETLIGMAARLQPRTAAFLVELDDVTVEMVDADNASVTLTVVIRRRTIGTDEESMDAREFAADVTRSGGPWQMQRVVAIDTLR